VISIIIPTFNEELTIELALGRLERVRGDFEVIVVDGASTDATSSRVKAQVLASARPIRLLSAERHRALQQNRAAAAARGGVLVFLHADTKVPTDAVEQINAALRNQSVIGGNFELIFEGKTWVERFFTWAYRVRRPFGIYYGDSGLFVRRKVFEAMGGFKPLPLMDDYEFVRRLERRGRTVCLPTSLTTSDRRWRVQGLLRTLWSWVWIQTLYSLGVPARHLARWYQPVRENRPVEGREPGVKPRATRAALPSEK
jgi:rSAM/selenodomain-associated transferase 2